MSERVSAMHAKPAGLEGGCEREGAFMKGEGGRGETTAAK